MKTGNNKAETDTGKRTRTVWTGQSQGQVSFRWAATSCSARSLSICASYVRGSPWQGSQLPSRGRGVSAPLRDSRSTTHCKAGQGQRGREGRSPEAAPRREGRTPGKGTRAGHRIAEPEWSWKGRQEIIQSNPCHGMATSSR